jgi:hypothetical protein
LYLFVIHSSDLPAIWLYRNLRKQGFDAIELITIDQLVNNRKLTVSLDDGKASFILDLFDGRRIDSSALYGLINRIQYLPFQIHEMFSTSDKEYVLCELQAIYTFFMSTFRYDVFNNVTTAGFNGRNRQKEEWLILASDSGFYTPNLTRNRYGVRISYDMNSLHSIRSILVYNGKCFYKPKTIQDEILQKCCEMQMRSGEKLLGIQLGRIKDKLYFINADTYPDFQLGGDDFINKLKEDLENGFAVRNTR